MAQSIRKRKNTKSSSKNKIKVLILIDKITIEVDSIDKTLRDLKDRYYEYMDILKFLRTANKKYITRKDLEDFNDNTINELLEDQ
jgi:hypothetical protein